MTELLTGLVTSLSTTDRHHINSRYDELKAHDEAGIPLPKSMQDDAITLLDIALSNGAYIETGSHREDPAIVSKIIRLASQLGVSIYVLDLGREPIEKLLSTLDDTPMRTYINYSYPGERDSEHERGDQTHSPIRKLTEAQMQARELSLLDYPAVKLVHHRALYVIRAFGEEDDNWSNLSIDEWGTRGLVIMSSDSPVTFTLTKSSQIHSDGSKLKLTDCSVSVPRLRSSLTKAISGIPMDFAEMIDASTQDFPLREAVFNCESASLEDFVTVEAALVGHFDTPATQ